MVKHFLQLISEHKQPMQFCVRVMNTKLTQVKKSPTPQNLLIQNSKDIIIKMLVLFLAATSPSASLATFPQYVA